MNPDQVARQLTEEVNHALNKKIEERFREALFLVDPALDMEKVTVVSNLEKDGELTVDGVDDETIDRAMAIFEQSEEDSR